LFAIKKPRRHRQKKISGGVSFKFSAVSRPDWQRLCDTPHNDVVEKYGFEPRREDFFRRAGSLA